MPSIEENLNRIADALEALEHAASLGCIAVKWLPNAMNIDPSSARCDAFYEAMKRLVGFAQLEKAPQ